MNSTEGGRHIPLRDIYEDPVNLCPNLKLAADESQTPQAVCRIGNYVSVGVNGVLRAPSNCPLVDVIATINCTKAITAVSSSNVILP